jgi:hypothetical protein
MIGIHKESLADWCNKNIDLLIIVVGVAIVFSTKEFGLQLNLNETSQNLAFWTLLIGVVTLSVGTSALICYRVLLRWHGYFG